MQGSQHARFRRDVGKVPLSGSQLGYLVNALLQTFDPSLCIVRYEEVQDFPDWVDEGERHRFARWHERVRKGGQHKC